MRLNFSVICYSPDSNWSMYDSRPLLVAVCCKSDNDVDPT